MISERYGDWKDSLMDKATFREPIELKKRRDWAELTQHSKLSAINIKLKEIRICGSFIIDRYARESLEYEKNNCD